jgi:hypothetical protein
MDATGPQVNMVSVLLIILFLVDVVLMVLNLCLLFEKEKMDQFSKET